jgi:hypothetical protein
MTVNRAAQQMKAVDQNGNDISSTCNWSSYCGLYTLMPRIFSVAVLLLLAMPAVAQVSGTATITVTGTPITGHADCPSPCTIKVAGKNLVNSSGQVLKIAGMNTNGVTLAGYSWDHCHSQQRGRRRSSRYAHG